VSVGCIEGTAVDGGRLGGGAIQQGGKCQWLSQPLSWLKSELRDDRSLANSVAD
jgi:hypothetical protein